MESDELILEHIGNEEEEENWNEPQLLEDPTGQHIGHIAEVSVAAICVPSTSTSSSGEPVNLMALNTNKAGMEGLDKERINKIIMEASKGSRFYENEKKKEAQVNTRIESMRQRMAKLTEEDMRSALIEVDRTAQELEESRDLSRLIVHLDMDAFYAAVEERDDPSLKDKPMAVGGTYMLSTSNYHARKYGVRAGMPGFIGMKLCPELVMVPTHFDKYRAVSKEVKEIMAEYDPNFCAMSLDEAYLDLTDHVMRRQSFTDAQRTFVKKDSVIQVEENGEGDDKVCDQQKSVCEDNGTNDKIEVSRTNQNTTDVSIMSCDTNQDVEDNACNEGSSDVKGDCVKGERVTFGLTIEDAVEEMRFRIQQKTQLTASAGIAPNCMLTKICSDRNKPNGQYRIEPTREVVMNFINVLPIRKVSGIGKVTERMLSSLGIHTCADLYQQRALLHLLFSQISSHHFLRISLGLGATQVERDSVRKSMSTERTFGEIHKPDELLSKCRELCEALAEDLTQAELKGKTVGIKIKTVKFEVKTRVCTVPRSVSSADELFNVAKDLLKTEIRACHPEPLRLRLMGVRLASLEQRGSSNDKQGTITNFFKKREPTKPSPTTNSDDLPLTSNSDSLQNTSWNQSVPSADTKNESATLPSNNDRNDADVSLVCPVCNKVQPTSCLETFNEHVDECLSQGARDESNSEIPDSRTETTDYKSKNNTTSNIIPQTMHDADSLININDAASPDHDQPTSSTIQPSTSSSDAMTQPTSSLSVREQPSRSLLVCPICNKEQETSDLEEFNKHVDMCLNKGAIKEILHQQAESDLQTTKRQLSPSKGTTKRNGSTLPQSTAKRRKQDKKQGTTLHKFFN